VSLPLERLRSIALSRLTAEEVSACVVYLATERVRRGETLAFARVRFTCASDGYLAFVDLDPSANWGHRCCYVCIDDERGAAERLDAQFPPFGPRTGDRSALRWQVIYRAPGVPDALIAVPSP
jgi:hypothetical protein